MRVDIDRLRAFYASPLGRMAEEAMARRVETLWPDANGLDVLGYGHADGLLEPFRAGARRVISAAPETQGAVRWPAQGKTSSVLVDEERLPFKDALFDRLIIRHGLEEAEGPRRLLREFWRVAAPEARILVIVAHRRGLWARAESTPFGHGRPYTRVQLYRLLEDAMFKPTASARALYAPPIGWGLITSGGDAWERIGRFAWGGFGGVLLIEAVKRLYIEPGGKAVRVRRAVKATAPQGATMARNVFDTSDLTRAPFEC
ncbi:MAG: methyltransferase domain-containing protein [Alphaproteobacteria bacterium]|nr:methyltransferase domain-containing protein [Alphaproteobacteria bacterium]